MEDRQISLHLSVVPILLCWILCCNGVYSTGDTLLIGCYQDNDRDRAFVISPGLWDPTSLQTTPSLCTTACGFISKPYAGIWLGEICFCADSITGLTMTSSSTCNSSDSDSITVYTAIADIQINDLEVIVENETVGYIVVGDQHNIEVQGTVVTQSVVSYQLSKQANNYTWENMQGNSTSTVFIAPGVQDLTARAVNSFTAEQGAKAHQYAIAAKEVRITEAPGYGFSNFSCQSHGVTGIGYKCTFMIERGSDINGTINWGNEKAEDFYFPDSKWERAGSPVGISLYDTFPGGSERMNLVNARFKYSGYLDRFELLASGTGSVNLLLLRPTCSSGQYCYSEDSCSSSGSECDHSLTCIESTTGYYLPVSQSCSNSCSPWMTQKIKANGTAVRTLSTLFDVVGLTEVALDTTGYHTVFLNSSWNVQPGDHIGFHSITSGIIAAKNLSSEGSDFEMTYGTTVALSARLTGSWNALDVQHQLSAVARPINLMLLEHVWNYTGEHEVKVSFKNPYIDSTNLQLMANASINFGINHTDIFQSGYAVMNENTTFELHPHTGSLLNYYWDFGDGNRINTTSTTVYHVYTSMGTRNVSVTVWNEFDSQSDFQLIEIRDRVNITSYFIPNATMNQQSTLTLGVTGTNYTCSWSIGSIASIVTAPGNSSSYSLTPTAIGANPYTINCTNLASFSAISGSFDVYEAVSGLQMVTTDVEVNASFTLAWSYTTGSNATSVLVVNNNTIPSIDDNDARTGRTTTGVTISTVQILTISVVVSNPVSSFVAVCNVSVNSRIAGANLNSSSIQTVSTNHTYVVSATSGSSVRVNFTWGDGAASNFCQPYGAEWTDDIIAYHTYSSPGRYQLSVLLDNGISNTTLTDEIFVLTSLGNYTLAPLSSYYDVGTPAQFRFLRVSGTPAMKTNVSFYWGDSSTPETFIFDVNATYNHTYASRGVFEVVALISNPISSAANCTVNAGIVHSVEALTCNFSPENVGTGKVMTVTVGMTEGDYVNVTLASGDGTPTELKNVTHATSSTSVTFNKVFSSVGTYNMYVSACNWLGCRNCTHTTKVDNMINETLLSVDVSPYGSLPGGTVSITLTWNGGSSTFPTNTNYTVSFNDSNPNLSGTWSVTNNPLALSRSLTDVGLYMGQVTLKNFASSYLKSTPVHIYEDFYNFKVSVLYRPSPFAALQEGMGPDKDKYPPNMDVHFTVSFDKGKAEWFLFSFQMVGNLTVNTCNMTGTNMTYIRQFTEVGTYKLSVMAYNPAFTKTITHNLTIGGSLRELKLQSQTASWKPLAVGILTLSWEVLTSDSCVCIDFGDKTAQSYHDSGRTCSRCQSGSSYQGVIPLTPPITIYKVYQTSDNFVINVLVYNDYANKSLHLDLPVGGYNCRAPVVETDPPHASMAEAKVVEKSLSATVIAVIVSLPCNMTYQNTKTWEIFNYNPETKLPTTAVNISKISTSNTRLDVPANFLDYGYYQLRFTVTMNKTITVLTFASTTISYLKIIPTNIIVRLVSGGMAEQTRGYKETITLRPERYSVDPDIPDSSAPQGIGNWTWFCRRQDEPKVNASAQIVYPKPEGYVFPTVRQGCFGDGPGRINTTAGSFQFWGGNMEVNKTYIFRVEATKGDRRSDTELQILIVPGEPPEITIDCRRKIMCKRVASGIFKDIEQSVNPSETLQLVSTCVGTHCLTRTYLWDFYRYNENATSDDDLWVPLHSQYTSVHIKGIDSEEVSIDPGLYTAIAGVKRFKTCFNAGEGINKGFGCLQFVANSLPKVGTCSYSPSSVNVETVVCLRCKDFSDSDGIERYSFIVQKQNESPTTLGFNRTGLYCSKLPYSDFPIHVTVEARDYLGGASYLSIANITIEKMELSQLNGALDKLLTTDGKQSLDEKFAKGDFASMGSAIIETAALLDAINADTTTADTQTTTEKVTNQNKRTDLISELVNHLDKMKPQEESTLRVTASALKGLSGNDRDMRRDSQEKLMTKAFESADVLDTIVGTMSKESVIEVGQPLVSAVINTLSMCNLQIDDPVPRDLDEAKQTMEYETDLESDSESFSGDFSQAANSLARETSASSQKQAAKSISSTGFSKVIKKVKDAMLKVMVPGDKPIVYDTGKGNMSFYKPPSADAIMNSSLASGNASVKIPNICGSLEKAGLTCNGSSFGMTFISTKFNAMSALPTNQKGGVPLGASNPVITLSLSTGNGTGIGVDTASDGGAEEFDIDVPMTEETIPFEPGNPNGGRPYLPEPRVRPGTGGYLEEPEYIWQKLFMHSLDIKGNDQSVHFEMRFNVCTQFLVVGKLADTPSLTDASVGYDFFGMIPSDIKFCNVTPSPDEPNPYMVFMDNQQFRQLKESVLQRVPDWQQKKRNTVYFGVRELRTDEHNVYVPGNPPPFPYPYTENITTNYDVRPFSKSCYSVNEDSGTQWSTGGCRVSNLTTAEKTKCMCTHLTSFSGGWAVAPNTIDFSYVFANFDFAKNPTLFATEISICVLYILAMLWAYFADKKDIEKLGVTPLADNDPKDQYLYEVTIQTGMRLSAGTDSKVCLILSGEDDETDVRALRDEHRKLFQRGDINRFLVSVPRPLGNLQYIRLWHDNSGKGSRAGWYCAYVGVLDLQTRLRYHFMVNSWLAVEESDGLVDRLIPVAGPDEIARFGEMFTRNAQRDLTDGHLWISVMTRPPESRFTRSARVTVCLFLLFLTMLATCMFYKKPGSGNKTSNALEIGPFRLSPEQVYVGIITNLITFLPIFIVVELFNKTRLYKSHSRSLLQSIKTHYAAGEPNFNSRSVFYREEEQPQLVSTPRSDFTTSLIPNEMPPPYSSRERLCDTPRSMDQVSVQVIPPDQQGLESSVKKKKKFLFPWWVRIFTWIFMALGTFAAAFFTTLYGIMFGDESCKQWLSSMFISFFSSILFTQPIKVICLAVFISLICKTADNLEEEDEEDDIIFNEVGQRNGLKYGEEFLHQKTLTNPIKPRRIQYLPPSEEALEKAREYRLKEVRIYDVLREIAFYLFFFLLLLLVSYTFRDPNAFDLKNQMVRLYTNPGDPSLDFSKIRNEDNFWNWTVKSLLPSLRAGRWYNNYPPLFQRGFVSDRAGRLMGYAVLRQLRVKDSTCVIDEMMRAISNHCVAEYSFGGEDRGAYGPGWTTLGPNVTAQEAAAANPSFVYRDSDSLNGYPYIGQIGTYSGGGYVYEMRGGISKMTAEILALRDNHWIDIHTRAIFIEFTTYVPNVNLFGMATLLLESPGTGGMWPSFRFEPANLLSFSGSDVKAFQIAYQALFILMLLFYLVKEIRKIYKQRKEYFFHIWNWCELFIIGASFGSIAAFVFMVMATNKLTAEFAKYHGNRYIKFQFVAYWHENLSYAVSFIVFAATLKFIRLLRFNKRMGMLGSVLSHTGKDIGQFFVLFALIFFAFVQVFYLLFMDSLYRYHTFLHSTEASMQIALGKFEFLELYEKEPYLGPLVFLGFVIFIIFVMLNMLLAILNEGFAVVRANLELQANEHELLDFLVRKLVLWSGMHQTNVGRKIFKEEIADQEYKEPDPRELAQQISNFPEKVDQLIDYIDKIYTKDKENDVNLPVPKCVTSPVSSITSKTTLPVRTLAKKRASLDVGVGEGRPKSFEAFQSAPLLGGESRPNSASTNNTDSNAPMPPVEQLEMTEM